MKSLRLVAASALALALGLGLGLGLVGPASAAQPTAGATYSGQTTESDTVVLTVSGNGNQVSGKLVDSCGDTYKLRGRRIKNTGNFKLTKKNEFGFVYVTISGKFVTKRKARGTVNTITCEGTTRSFTAKRQ